MTSGPAVLDRPAAVASPQKASQRESVSAHGNVRTDARSIFDFIRERWGDNRPYQVTFNGQIITIRLLDHGEPFCRKPGRKLCHSAWEAAEHINRMIVGISDATWRSMCQVNPKPGAPRMFSVVERVAAAGRGQISTRIVFQPI